MKTVTVIDPTTLLGRELKSRFEPHGEVELVSSAESAGKFTEIEGEATVLPALDLERLRYSDLVLCAGDARSTYKVIELVAALREAPMVVDVTGAADGVPHARLTSPLEALPSADNTGLYVLAHPAAAAIAATVGRLHPEFPIRHSVVHVFLPASETGLAGVEELQGQVASLLSFRQMSKSLWDAQLGFNMLPQYGQDSAHSLAEIELRIERHLAGLLGGVSPLPSLRAVQAPVFHGHSFSFWIDFEQRPDAEQITRVLASTEIEVRGPDLDVPTNVGVAGESGVVLGMLEPDRNHRHAVWCWAAMDSVQVLADGAFEVARELLEGADE